MADKKETIHMSKKDFIDAVAERTGATKKDTEKFVSEALDTITEVLKTGGDVRFTGFGAFATKTIPARNCISPQTKEIIAVPEKEKPVFKPGKDLKEAIAK